MTLKNITTGKIICEDLKIAESFTDRMFGLLIKSNPRAMLFKTRFGIHTLFLKSPIDVLILDSKNQVVARKKSLRPFHFYFWKPIFNLVIELPHGTIEKSKTKTGDLIFLERV